MTNKDKVIAGIKELILKRYTLNLDINCPLCDIFAWCKGCPSANKRGGCDCDSQPTFRDWGEAFDLRKEKQISYQMACKARKVMWEKALPILEKLPASRFTKAGFKFFEEIKFMWEE